MLLSGGGSSASFGGVHSSILSYICSFVITAFNTPLTWDGNSWTIMDYIKYCFCVFLIFFVMWNLFLFAMDKIKEM